MIIKEPQLRYYWWSAKQEMRIMEADKYWWINPWTKLLGYHEMILSNGIQYSQVTQTCDHETKWDDIQLVSVRFV